MKGQTDLQVEPLDITEIEKAWEIYLNMQSRRGVIWLGMQVGPLLREIRILRTRVEGLQLALDEERQMYARA